MWPRTTAVVLVGVDQIADVIDEPAIGSAPTVRTVQAM